ncbi:hypothetical protein RhiirC2_844126 [Rhizophagus irregularis]|uniref:Uncharacterized protein n=1 Tax=Rhizophagus irregularis TaxID=588596 RepID=A0A2N1NUV7_9GLOM|nr:hypothetical protein RhiirC2_844126 [Rhizophagus irregularis]
MGAKVGKLLVAVSCIVGGLVIIPFITVPTHKNVLTIGNSIFIGAGAAEIFACLFGKQSWGEFWKKLGIWALIGLITTCASFIAINCVKQLNLVATRLENHFSNASKHDISALLSAGSAIFSTGVTNLIEGGPIVASAFFGGLLTYGILYGSGNFYEKTIGYIKKLCQITIKHKNKVALYNITNFLEFTPIETKLYKGSDGENSTMPSTQTANVVDVLESRSWNEGARIYSTRDSIETFRSQSERYNYPKITSEFGDEVYSTITNTTVPEYVYSYAYSDTNMSIASSSSNAPLINHTRATNENFLSPQSNWSVMSSQNNQDTIMTNEFNQSNQSEKNTRLSVKLHPIICWNMDEQKYFFSNPSLFSTFSNNVKVVGFIGTKKSGRTTAIHSLLFELGYYLTEEQLAKSLLPVGVMMYVLKEHDLILLDCCDIADSVTTKAGNLLSGYLLEFFTYMASSHLVIHTAIPQETESDQSMFSEQLTSYIHSKAKLLLLWASTIQTRGPSMLTVLVRGSKQQCETLDISRINLFSSQTNIMNPNNDDKIIFTRGFQNSKAFAWQYIPEEIITARTLTNDNFAVFSTILKRIKDETELHGLSFSNGIQMNWQYLFTKIMSNSILSQSVSDLINYDIVQVDDEKTGGLIQEYINSVNRLVENSAIQGSVLATKYKTLCEDFKRRMDIEKNKPDDEKDPIIGLKINIEIAKCLLESSISETDLQTKDNLISWGLHGLTLIQNRSLKIYEHTWIKLCIKTYNILDLLNTPIYNTYWHCWNFLSFVSSCGFKLELLKWQILERALYCLKTSSNRPRFHFHVLNCFLNFVETEPYLPVRICLPPSDENNQTSLNEDQYYRLERTVYYGITEYSKKCVREAAEQQQSTNMEKYLEEIKDIVSKQFKVLSNYMSLSSVTPESFSALDEHQQFTIVGTALARLNTDIAFYISKHIFGGDKLIDLFFPDSPIEVLQDYHETVRDCRWLFLQRIASLQDDECTRNLIESTLHRVVNFLKKFPRNEASDSYAILYVNTLVFAECIMQKRRRTAEQRKKETLPSRQQMTMSDFNIKKRKVEDEGDFGVVRMALLSQKCLKPVLKELLRGLKSQDFQTYLKSNKVRRYALYIDNLLFAPHNSHIFALSLDEISINDRNLLRVMVFQAIDICIKAFWKRHLGKEELAAATTQLSIIHNTRALIRLLNRIYWMIAKNKEFESIRGPSIIFGSQDYITSGSIHSLISSDNTLSSEILADDMIQRIGPKNWLNLVTLTSIPHILSYNISKIDPDNSLNLLETVLDVKSDALILLWNLAECSDVSLKGSKNVMTTNNFRPTNVVCEFSDASSFDENGINRIKFLVDRVVSKVDSNNIVDVSEITNQELHNRLESGKTRAIKLKKQAEISENIEKQMEEQRLKPNIQAMTKARLKRFSNN